MKIYVFNRENEEKWSTEAAAAIVAESPAIAEALYRHEFEDEFGIEEFTIEEFEIISGLMLEAWGYDMTQMLARHLTMDQPQP